MLNFTTIDNANAFAHSIALHGGNFVDVPTSMVTSSSTASASAQAQHINLNYLNANTSGDPNWTESVHSNSTSTIDNNCNRNNVTNNNLPNSNQQKDYLHTVINGDETNGRSPLSMDNYLQQKGSENVKRFSVNNLLQLANNCRALVDEQRIATGKLNILLTF